MTMQPEIRRPVDAEFYAPDKLETHPPSVDEDHLDDLADVLFAIGRLFLIVVVISAVILGVIHFSKVKAEISMATNPHCARGVCVMPLERE